MMNEMISIQSTQQRLPQALQLWPYTSLALQQVHPPACQPIKKWYEGTS